MDLRPALQDIQEAAREAHEGALRHFGGKQPSTVRLVGDTILDWTS
jgi:hypothetical protein